MKRDVLIESIIYQCLSWDGLKIDSSGVPLEEIVSDIINYLDRSDLLVKDWDKDET